MIPITMICKLAKKEGTLWQVSGAVIRWLLFFSFLILNLSYQLEVITYTGNLFLYTFSQRLKASARPADDLPKMAQEMERMMES